MIHRENLEKLADYLLGLPEGYQYFDMSEYSQEKYPYEHTCETIGCAIGHAPLAGIAPLCNEDWHNYVSRNFLSEFDFGPEGDIFEWCFNYQWESVDNTPRGAGLRIKWFLQHGLPEDWESQMNGETPLCYDDRTTWEREPPVGNEV